MMAAAQPEPGSVPPTQGRDLTVCQIKASWMADADLRFWYEFQAAIDTWLHRQYSSMIGKVNGDFSTAVVQTELRTHLRLIEERKKLYVHHLSGEVVFYDPHVAADVTAEQEVRRRQAESELRHLMTGTMDSRDAALALSLPHKIPTLAVDRKSSTKVQGSAQNLAPARKGGKRTLERKSIAKPRVA